MVLVGTGLVCSTVPITTGDRAAGRDRRRRCRCSACPCARVHRGSGVVRCCVAGRITVHVSGPIGLRLHDHLRTLRHGSSLVVRHHERRILLLCNAHVVTGVRFLHYVSRTL